MRKFIAICVAMAVPGIALADDPLVRFAPWFAANPSGLVFHYSAPLEGFHLDAPTVQGPTDDGLREVVFNQTGIDPVSGLDIDAIDGVLSISGPPNDLLVLLGEQALSAGIGPALLRRDFEQHEIGGLPVFGMGDDHAMDFTGASMADPFDGGMGRAQRVAIGNGFVAVSRSWPSMTLALKRLTKPKGAAMVWANTLEALDSARGAAHLDAAWGWGGESFADTLFDPVELLERGPDAAQTVIEGGPELLFPPFPIAIFTLDRDATTARLRIALPYGGAEDAQVAADYVADKLADFPLVPAAPRIDIVAQGNLSIALLTLEFAEAEARAASELMLDWVSAIYRRDFVPLQYGLF